MIDFSGQSFGRYHIIERLGEGGMATIYKAYDTHLECEVAVKVIRTDQLPPAVLEQALKRFEREAKEVAKLNHPNIVRVIDYGEHEGIPFLVMPYLSGGTLKQLLGKPIHYINAIEIILPIARALNYAHQRKMIHRDVKPANILISDSGDVMLTDFGIVKMIDQAQGRTLTGTGVGIGTPEYMSPEQGVGKEIDERADIYSLGVVFYELITGQKPYTADTPMAVVIKHISDPLPRPKNLVPDISDKIEQIIIKALAKDPNNRYQTINEFINALENQKNESIKNAKSEDNNQIRNKLINEIDSNKTWDNIPNYSSDSEKILRTIPNIITQNGKKKFVLWFLWIGIPALVILVGFFYFKNIWSARVNENSSVNQINTSEFTPITMVLSTTNTTTPTQTLDLTFDPTLTPVPPIEYIVTENDVCSSIALLYNVSIQSIVSLNNLRSDCTLYQGQKILIPIPTPTSTAKPTSTASGPQLYEIKAGDSCFSIAEQFNVDILVLMGFNNFPDGSCPITPGQIITIPSSGQKLPTPTPIPSNLPRGTEIYYTIQVGDTLALIASQFNSTVMDIMTRNKITDQNQIYPGQMIIVRVNLVTPTTTRQPTNSG